MSGAASPQIHKGRESLYLSQADGISVLRLHPSRNSCPKPILSVLTRKRIRRGSFHSIVDLQAAIKRDLAEHNAEPRPFVWTASAASILAKLDRLAALTV